MKNIHLREKVNSFVPPRNGVIDNMDCNNDHNWSHIWLFELFFDDELLDQIVPMTNTYAVEQSAVGWNSIDNSTLRAFIRTLILSGYNQLRSYKMYLEEASDLQQPLVCDAMPRNRFPQILSYIHFSDNANLNQNGKCAKVRPLLDMCKERFRKFAMKTKSINVDESMIPYFGQRLKQRMPLSQFDQAIKYGA